MKNFKKGYTLISRGLLRDQRHLKRDLKKITDLPGSTPDELKIKNERFEKLLLRINQSIKQKKERQAKCPKKISSDPNLPISARENQIVDAVRKYPVVIISGETGSGKTTQIPKFCLKAGRGINGLIGCTQPRRIAAINVAKRIAEEMGQSIGQAVGYKIRFDDKTDSNGFIKLMTDGIILAETQNDPFLNAYDTIIVDEAHERSLNIDFTLGILRRLVKKRKDLKLVITSATIDTEKFSKAFDNAPIIEVSGRTFPVETVYTPILGNDDQKTAAEDQDYVEATANAVYRIITTSKSGDILVFMPSEQDIGDTMELIRGRRMAGIVVLPLFARLPAKEQSKVFSRGVGRKVIVSTNVAETSLTIPGIKYVVDTGLARIPGYSPRTRTTSLPVSPISQSSANQRMGRCGRVENGVCIRLYDEDDFRARPFFTAPEILRSNLAEVILRMISLNLGDVATFPFIDAPNFKSIKDGFDTLLELGAIKRLKQRSKKKGYTLTRIGRVMAKLPIDPKLSRILIEADKKGCLHEAAVITTALAIPDPRQRPAEKAQAADQQHALFKDPGSDFITLLNIWNAFKDAQKKLKSRSKLIQFCQKHFLSFKRMREWMDIHRQIIRILKENNLVSPQKKDPTIGTKGLKSKAFELGGPLYIALHQSLLTGYLAHIAHKKEKNIFQAAKGQQAMIFPGSGLFDKAGDWIVAAEYVKTSQLFARTVANIDPQWLEPIAGDLCTYSYSDPHWEKKRGEVTANEQVSLFGLVIVAGRKVAYGRINPDEAGTIFIRNALVEGEIQQKFEFMIHNQELIQEVEALEDKTRSKDILAGEEDIFLFYQKRLPKLFYNIRRFSKFIKDQKNQDFLKMTREDIQKADVEEDKLALYPDTLSMPDGKFKLEYAFDPGSSKDGVTIQVPKQASSQVSKNRIDRLVPGLFEEKVTALIKNLPKSYRKKLVPVSQKAAIIARDLPNEDRPLYSLLSRFIKKRFKLTIPESLWSDKELADHLKMRISIRDQKGREIEAVRDKSILNRFVSNRPSDEKDLFSRARKTFEKSKIRQWDFGDLSPSIDLKDDNGFIQKVYLRLHCDENKADESDICLKLFKAGSAAKASHIKGVKQLYLTTFTDHFRALKKDINRSAQIKKIAPSFSGQTNFQTDIFNFITDTCFAKDIRTKEEFDRVAKETLPDLYAIGREIIDTIIDLGTVYQGCFALIQKLSFENQNKKKTFELLTRIFNELKNLVPENFAALYTLDRIRQLHRYINCLSFRAQKAVENPLKEEQKSGPVDKYTQQLKTLLSSLNADSSPEKASGVENLFWLIEEYKISVFAQHQKTAEKVSAKRLDKFITHLSGII